MMTVVLYAVTAWITWVVYLLYCYLSNCLLARRLNFPQIHVPLVVQNSIPWMIGGPVSRLWLKSKLPTWMFNKLGLTIYGVEWFQRMQPYDEYVKPQLVRNPKLLGKGKTYTLVTSGKLELWTWDCELAAQVAARPKDFNQFEAASFVMSTFGANVLTTDGNEWSRHRRIVAGAVTERINPVVFQESVRQTRGLFKHLQQKDNRRDSSRSMVTHEMFDMIKRITINVLYAAGMGNKQDFDQVVGNDTLPGMKLSYIEAVKIVNEHASGTAVIPTWLLLNWPTWLPGTETLRALGQAKIEFPQHTRAALAKEKALEAKVGSARNNVLSALISASQRDSEGDAEKGKTRKGPALSDDELVGNSYIFSAAGFDTTANTLAYCLVTLARYPEWQDWVIEELDELLPEDRSAEFDYAAIFPKALRTVAIMYETVRLYPPVIHITKQTARTETQVTTSEGVLNIPPKTTVYCNNVLLHRDPEIWRDLNITPAERTAAAATKTNEKLADEHVFRPSRWLNPPGSASPFFKPPKGSFLAWSDGPRVCPGKSMAAVEFAGIFVTLFSEHKMEAARTENHDGQGNARMQETDEALRKRLDALVLNSTPKLTLEMDVYNAKEGEDRGLGLRWIKRR